MGRTVVAPNTQLQRARRARSSPVRPGQHMSRPELANVVNSLLHSRDVLDVDVDANYIGKLEMGQYRWPRSPHRRWALRTALEAATDTELGLFPTRSTGQGDSVPLPDVPQQFTTELVRAPTSTGSLAPAGPGRYLSDPLGSAPHWTDNAEVLRRTVLRALSAAAGSAVAGVSSHESPTFDVDRTLLTAGTDHWREAVWEYGYAYHTVAREALLRDLSADLDAISRQLFAHLAADDAEAKPIAAVSSQLVALTAMCCTDLGFAREGRHLWRFARRYAEISEDAAVQQWVKGHEITSGIYQQRPLRVLFDLASRALDRHSESIASAGKAELLGGQAQLFALMGKNREAHSLLDLLGDTYAQLPTTVTILSDSIFGWPQQRLHHAESFVNSMSGSTDNAYRAQERALALYAPSRPISRCQIELHRARCLIRDGHIGDGLRHSLTAVVSVDPSRRREFILATANHVLGAVPSKELSRPEAREFSDLIGSARLQALSGRE